MWCRYKHLHGKFVVHPLDGRKVPIIQDAELVDMSFGTGAVKITPAHDPNDFATGKRHNLQCINILDDDGRINAHGGQFAGQPRFQVMPLWRPSNPFCERFSLNISEMEFPNLCYMCYLLIWKFLVFV